MGKRRADFIVFLVLAWIIGLSGSLSAATSILTGDYYGSVTVDSPAGLGNIDLAFHLEMGDGSAMNTGRSYVLLDKTILFPKVGQVDGKDVGPMAAEGSSFDGRTLHFTTREFSATVNNRNVTRTFTLNGTASNLSGNSITGTYVETITGYVAKPLIITGSFVLVRPISISPGAFACRSMDMMEPIGVLTIEEIRAGGSNPEWVEFEDLSCALYFYHHPESGMVVSDTTIGQATADYKAYLQQ